MTRHSVRGQFYYLLLEELLNIDNESRPTLSEITELDNSIAEEDKENMVPFTTGYLSKLPNLPEMVKDLIEDPDYIWTLQEQNLLTEQQAADFHTIITEILKNKTNE